METEDNTRIQKTRERKKHFGDYIQSLEREREEKKKQEPREI